MKNGLLVLVLALTAFTIPRVEASSCGFYTTIDLAFGLAADSADATMCLNNALGVSSASEARSIVQGCFIQRRLKSYLTQISSGQLDASCGKWIQAKCEVDFPCPSKDFPQARCGHLGTYLRNLEQMGLSDYFTKSDGINYCRSLTISKF